MKLVIDPMPALRADAEKKINDCYNGLAYASIQQDQEHSAKRRLAATPDHPDFIAAAAVEGVAPSDLAALILSKPDDVMLRAAERRTKILAARAATTPEELLALTKGRPT